MYCERCNIDFPEGLRYCKWCGQDLVERKRVTSELHTCSVCSAAIQPNWTFCKSCGVKLTPTTSEAESLLCSRCGVQAKPGDVYCLQCGHELTRPLDSESKERITSETPAFVARCSSCGEELETGFKYCKNCGVPVPGEFSPSDSSPLVCNVCTRYSPAGSRVCVVCGAPLALSHARPSQTAKFDSTKRERSDTLRDLADHLPEIEAEEPAAATEYMEPSAKRDDEPGEATAIFERDDQSEDHTEEMASVPASPVDSAGSEPPVAESSDWQLPEQTVELPRTDAIELKTPPSQDPSEIGMETNVLSQDTDVVPLPAPLTVLIQKRKSTHPVKEEESMDAAEPVAPADPFEDVDTHSGLSSLKPTADESGPVGEPVTEEPDEQVESETEPPAPDMGRTQQIGAGFIDFESLPDETPFAYEDESASPPEKQSPAETFVFAGLDEEDATMLSREDAPDAPPDESESELDDGETEVLYQTGSFGPRPDVEPELPSQTIPDQNARADHPQPSSVPLARDRAPSAESSSAAMRPATSRPTPIRPATGSPATGSPAIAGRKNSVLVIALSAVAVLMIGAIVYAVWAFVFSDSQPEPIRQETTVTETPPPAPPPVAQPVAPEGMVMVEGGAYIIGRDDGDDFGKPAYTVNLSAFYIDRTEVTNAAYKAFVEATAHTPPEGWKGGTYPDGQDDWPVTGVTWQDAADYATWAGKRLPTEEEWEAAARGPDGRIYPWGDDWDASRANIGTKGIKPVGQYADSASPAGALDMIGNVWEWTASEFELYPNSPTSPPNLKTDVTYRVFRGGAYDGNKIHTASYRGFDDGNKRFQKTGFRCAKDADR